MKKIFLLLMICLTLPMVLGLTSLGTIQQNTNVNLIQVCDNCTYVNLTTITYPNFTIKNVQENMTLFGNTYNYTFTDTNTLGKYIYTTCGDANGINTCESVDFIVNPAGNTLTTAESIVYVIFLLALAFVFILFLYGAIAIPYKSPRGDDGRIVNVNDIRYFKPVCMVLAYLLLMSFFGIMRQITANYLFLNGAYRIFQWLFFAMLSFTFPAIVVSVIFILIALVENQKIKNALERGVPLR